ALQELWNRLLIVAFGEVDEGAFPSLAIGATKWIFEDLFREARELKVSEAEQVIDLHIRRSPLLLKQHLRILAQLTEADATKPLQT
ncbi:hypothetical protein, partial [Staphylococcus epidermidis]|uniref:hypothetical protein n=1 Tax=Staphylococcus epidermidis TaxID=1282 RepID=UPI0027381F94